MKQETKAKIKKALKWTGFAVLCAFACFGAVVACSLATANGAEAKSTAETSATQRADHTPRRALTPKRALDPTEYPYLVDEPDNLLLNSDYFRDAKRVRSAGNGEYEFYTNGNYAVLGLRSLPTGVYRLEYRRDEGTNFSGSYFLLNGNGYANATDPDYDGIFARSDTYANEGQRDLSPDFVRDIAIVNNGLSDDYCNLVVNVFKGLNAKLSLLNVLDVSPSDVLTLPSDWSPTAWVSNRSIGGYPMLATTYTTSGNAGNSSLHVGWNNVTFRTANDDRVFTQLRVRYRWMWNGAKFKTRQGQYATYDWDTGVADNYLLFPYSVEFFDRLANQWFQVAEQDYEWGSNAEAIITDKLKWINERYRTLYFLSFPESPQFVTISEYTTDLWATSNPLPIVMRYGLTFGDWFGLGSGWASPTITDVGTGDAIGVIRSAFSGLLPLLNIAILPNITLGLLLFLPMIGGIIILIIKAVNK